MANKSRDTANLVSAKTGIAVTITGDPVVLGVGSTELVRVTGGGLVGIGTTNPNGPLHIIGDGNTVPNLTLHTKTNTNKANWILFKDDGGNTAFIGHGESTSNLLDLWNYKNDGIRFGTNSTERVRITTGGEVGIGTTHADAYTVAIHGTAQNTNPTHGSLKLYGSNYAFIGLRNSGDTGADNWFIGHLSAATANTLAFRYGTGPANATGALYLHTDNVVSVGGATTTGTPNSVFQVNTGGAYFANRVGIGTTNPTTTLQVTDSSGGGYLLLGAKDNAAQYQYINFNGTNAGDHAWQLGRSPSGGVGPLNGFYLYNLLTSTSEIGISTAGDVMIGSGNAASCKLQIMDGATHTAYGGQTPTITSCTLAIANTPASEAINNHATMQFNVNGGSYNRVCSISAVAESASTRKGMLTFCTDDAGSRSEKMRITGEGQVLIGSQTTNVKLYVYDNTGLEQTIYAWQNGTGAYAGLFQCNAGDSTQYAIYGLVNTSSSYSSGGVLGYSINSSKYAIIGYWSTAAYYGVYSNGLIYASGGFSSSDERLKNISSRIENGVLDNLTSLVPVEYTWKDNTEQGRGLEGVTQIGLIAQEVEVNFPHLVMENYHTRITGVNTTSLNEEIGMCKSVEYGKLTCYLLVALTEAYDKIKALEQHVGIAST